jgi:acyl-CoA dehydrogenase
VEDLLELAKKTELNGRPAIEDSGVRQRIADFYVDFAGLKNTSYRTLTALSKGTTPGPEASIMKLVFASLAQHMASLGIEILGPTGAVVDEEGGWQEAYLSAPGMRLAGGSDEILLNIIAERVLGLPPEPRVDKGIAFRDIPTGPPS